MNVIFLDIDGVLNNHSPTPSGYCGVDPKCRDWLNWLLEETGAFLIISSAWRYLVHGGSMTVAGLENLLLTHGVRCQGKVIGITDRDHDIWDRGDQIAAWMADHPEVDRYVVLDDLDLGITRRRHPFVLVDGMFGLMVHDALQAATALGSTIGMYEIKGRMAPADLTEACCSMEAPTP